MTPNKKKDKYAKIKEEARRIFNPYGIELNFNEKDWEVFLNRIELILDQREKEIVEEMKKYNDKLYQGDGWMLVNAFLDIYKASLKIK